MSEFTLTEGQQNAYEAFSQFILDPIAEVFVIEGYSGTGKTTLVQTLIDRLPRILSAAKTIYSNDMPRWETVFTATTNKAAEAFAQITGQDVRTIHAALGLRVHKDYSTGKSKLVVRYGVDLVENSILFIDEASYVDTNLLKLVFERTRNCKVVFIGDPAQLLTVGCNKPPVFSAGFQTAKLTEVVRQAEGNPIIDLGTSFRNTVSTGDFFSFIPDGIHVQHMTRPDFDQAIIDEFSDPDWCHIRSKVLAWTNKTVISYNHAIRDHVKGAPNFHTGDYAICNRYLSNNQCTLKTDQLVHITGIDPDTDEFGIIGNYFTLDGKQVAFMPKSPDERKALLKQAKSEKNYAFARMIEEQWIDLRAAYSCTINKSQGSTYNKVFIDLDDIKKCNSGNQIARMLYVGASRARHHVYLCGDLV